MQALLINSIIAVVFLTVVAVLSNVVFYLRSHQYWPPSSPPSTGQADGDWKVRAQILRRKNEYQNRIPENKLHAFSSAAAGPAIGFARARSATKPRKFLLFRFSWLTVAINVAITYALLIHYADNPLTNFRKTKLKQRISCLCIFLPGQVRKTSIYFDGFAGHRS